MRCVMGKVISGDYTGNFLYAQKGDAALHSPGLTGKELLKLNKSTVESYELIDATSKKGVGSAVTRGAIGSLLLGPVGLAAAVTAKNKGSYLIAIKFKDGKKSLAEVDDKTYRAIVASCF